MDLILSKKDTLQKANPVHGVGNGPSGTPFSTTRAKEFRDAGIPFSRTHDIEGLYGSGEYINIHCIFKNFDADVNSPDSYYFKPMDIYISKIIEAGTKVFYRLGETIENQPIATMLPKYITPPKDYLKWAEICEHIIRHYNEGWADGFHYKIEYWEIWNEPDNTQMWTGTPEEFYELYRVASNHLKKCFPHLKIGGMASSGFYAATRECEKPYFALRTYNEIYKLGTLIDTGFENGNGYYAIGATNGEESAVMLSNYNVDDVDITLDISAFGQSTELVLTDAENDFASQGQLETVSGKVKFAFNKNSIVLIKISK